MRKSIIISLVLLFVIGFANQVRAESGTVIFGEVVPGYELEVEHPEQGRIRYQQPIKTIAGRIAWCLQMYNWVYDQSDYETTPVFDYLTPEVQQDLELIVHVAWTLTPQSYEDYFITTLLIWERLGYSWSPTLADSDQPNPTGLQQYTYQQRRDQVFALVEEYKRLSSLQGQVIQLRVGETVELEDTTGVLAKLLEQTNPLTHSSFVRDGNKIRVTGLSVGKDDYLFGRVLPEHKQTTLFWKSPANYQDIATLGLSQPYETQFQVEVIESTGRIELKKLGHEDRSLVGVAFSLLNEAGEVVRQAKTNDTGMIEFTDLPFGNYLLREDEPLPGYVPLVKPYQVTVDQVEPKEVTIKNQPTCVEVLKVDDEDKPLEGAVIQLLAEDETLIDEWVSENTPKTFYLLPFGKYRLREVKSPTGYQGAKEVEFEVKAVHEKQTIKLINQPGMGEVIITKQDIGTGKAIPGATISLYRADGTMISSQVTDEQGLVRFTELAVGKYYYQETHAPLGYILNEGKHEFEILEHRQVIKSVLPNQKIVGHPVVKKFDVKTKQPLAGAVFELYSETDELIETQVTDAEGQAKFSALSFGRYYVVEKQAPKGYQLDQSKHWFEILEPYAIVTIELPNQLIMGEFRLTKVDGVTGKPLAGVTFELWEGEKSLGNFDTDAAGIIRLELPLGDYQLCEVKPLPGYQALTEVISFSITESELKLSHTVKNQPVPKLPKAGVGRVVGLLVGGVGLITTGLVLRRR